MDNQMIQNIARQIIAEAKQSRSHYNATGNYFDKVKANMYTIFECYANGIIDWELSNIKLQSVIKEYVNLYPKENRKAEIKIMREEYKRMKTEYKPALDAYKVVAEQKMTSSLVTKQKLDESTAQHHSNVFYNGRNLTEADLKDISTLKTWKRVMEAYPNLTAKDEDCVRMLTIFENTYNTRDFEFNPRAGHRDQPDHPENRGLTPGQAPRASLRPKLRPKNLAPMSSPRPQARPANLQMRNDINKAVQQAVGEGDSPHKKGTAKYKAHMAAMHAEGYKVMPPMDPKYVERSGLEGPFTTLSGKVVYYDPKEGSYYDPDTDMYMSYDEFQQYDNDYSGMKDERDEVKEAQIDKMKFVSKGFSNRKEAERQNDQLVGSGKASQKSYVYKHKDNKFYVVDMKDERDKVKENPTTRPNNRPTVPADAEADELLGRIANHQQNVDHFLKVSNTALNHPVAVGLRNRRVKEDEVSEEMNDAEIDAFHRALDNLVHKHLGHSSDEKDDIDESEERPYVAVHAKKGKTEVTGSSSYDAAKKAAAKWKLKSTAGIDVYLSDVKHTPTESAMESESQFDGHDIMSEDPPNGIDFDYANLSKVNWDQYSEEDIKTFYSIVDNLSFESGYYNDGEFDDSHFNALQWLEKNVMNKTEVSNAVKETLSPEEKRLVNQMYNKDGTLTDIGRQVMNHGKKKDSKKTDESTASGLTQSVMARAIEEMTSAGAIASVAAPMGKMKRRKDSIFADKESKQTAISEAQFDEAAGEKDACYHKVKSRYKVWPSAYASGALVKCRKVGAANWGNSKK